jgi:hypothetical protein
MYLDKVILKPDGHIALIGYPTQKEIDTLPRKKDGSPDITKLPNETCRTLILQCLNFSKTFGFDESMAVMAIGKKVREEGNIRFNDYELDLLKKIVRDQIYEEKNTFEGKVEKKGIYRGWAIAQVLQELGEQTNVSLYTQGIKKQEAVIFPVTVRTDEDKK